MPTTDNQATSSAFTAEDKVRARRALEIHWFAIAGAGLRSEFDILGGGLESVLGRGPRHRADLDWYERQLREFGELVAILETFKDRPITEPHPLAWQASRPQTLTRVIDEQVLAAYRLMEQAFTAYFQALRRHGSGSSEVIAAAQAAACVIRPEECRKLGLTVPENATSSCRYDARFYLEAVYFAD